MNKNLKGKEVEKLMINFCEALIFDEWLANLFQTLAIIIICYDLIYKFRTTVVKLNKVIRELWNFI